MSPEQMARLDRALASYCFKVTLVTSNTDSNYPQVLRVYSPAAHWMGQDVPASKWGGDNPDNAYRIIPIDAGGQYEITGKRQIEPSTYVSFQVVGDTSTSQTLGSLEQRNVVIDKDGRYTLTLDNTPGPKPNHVQILPGAKFLFIRDSMGDWAKQAPDALRVRRLNPPARPPLSEDELAKAAIHNIQNDVFYAYYASRLFFNSPQTMSQPEGAGPAGGLVTQTVSLGQLVFKDDEAVVITVSPADAAYRNIVLHDCWLNSLEYRDHLSSFTNAQMRPDADGRYTFVISIKDPGIYNWLDTTGLHEVLVANRWQGLPAQGSHNPPKIESRIVKFSALASALPPGVRTITADERKTQIAERQASYDRRFIDR
jgi:hypothetical protein